MNMDNSYIPTRGATSLTVTVKGRIALAAEALSAAAKSRSEDQRKSLCERAMRYLRRRSLGGDGHGYARRDRDVTTGEAPYGWSLSAGQREPEKCCFHCVRVALGFFRTFRHPGVGERSLLTWMCRLRLLSRRAGPFRSDSVLH
jgi:hypothetical protein